jgi:hypothetical protein
MVILSLKVVPRLESFAPWTYYLKATFIWGMAVALEMYMHSTANYRWWIAAVCGWFYALIGTFYAYFNNIFLLKFF